MAKIILNCLSLLMFCLLPLEGFAQDSVKEERLKRLVYQLSDPNANDYASLTNLPNTIEVIRGQMGYIGTLFEEAAVVAQYENHIARGGPPTTSAWLGHVYYPTLAQGILRLTDPEIKSLLRERDYLIFTTNKCDVNYKDDLTSDQARLVSTPPSIKDYFETLRHAYLLGLRADLPTPNPPMWGDTYVAARKRVMNWLSRDEQNALENSSQLFGQKEPKNSCRVHIANFMLDNYLNGADVELIRRARLYESIPNAHLGNVPFPVPRNDISQSYSSVKCDQLDGKELMQAVREFYSGYQIQGGFKARVRVETDNTVSETSIFDYGNLKGMILEMDGDAARLTYVTSELLPVYQKAIKEIFSKHAHCVNQAQKPVIFRVSISNESVAFITGAYGSLMGTSHDQFK